MTDDDSEKIIVTDPLNGKDKEITRDELREMLAKGVYIDEKSIKKEEK
ncbi:MAG: hypothetical protein WA087_01800 [Candidatus Saccharimonadales bacterium]